MSLQLVTPDNTSRIINDGVSDVSSKPGIANGDGNKNPVEKETKQAKNEQKNKYSIGSTPGDDKGYPPTKDKKRKFGNGTIGSIYYGPQTKKTLGPKSISHLLGCKVE